MATEGPMMSDGGQTTANADLSTKYGFVVKLAAARKVDLIAASTDMVYGILQNKPTAGQAADVAMEGICKGIAGAGISAGAKVMSNTSGKLITFVGSAGNTMVGYAVDAPGGDLEIFTVRLCITPVVT